MKRMRAAEDQLDARSLERFIRRELLQLIRESRREYEKKRALLLGTPKWDKMVRPPTPASQAETSLSPAARRRFLPLKVRNRKSKVQNRKSTVGRCVPTPPHLNNPSSQAVQ